MAMTTCRECGKEVSDGAATCPNCGVAKPWKRAKQPTKVSKSVAVLAIIAVLVVIAWASSMPTAPTAGSEVEPGTLGTQEYVAKEYCRQGATMQLKSPATAKWGDAATEYSKDLGKGRYHVQLQVDAENSFGGLLRNTVDCKLTLRNDSVRAIAIQSWGR